MTVTKPHLRRLTRDVTNPNADRDYHDTFHAESVWPAGTLVQVYRKEGVPPYTEIDYINRPGLENRSDGVHQTNCYQREGFDAIMSGSEFVDYTKSFDLMHKAYAGTHSAYRDIVKALVKRGRLSLAELEGMLDDTGALDAEVRELD